MTTSRQEIESAEWFRRQVEDAQPLARDRDPWERQPGESRQAYSCFVIYVELGPATRSLQKVVQMLAEGGTRKSLALLKRWSKKWQWVLRADEKDKDEVTRRGDEIRARRVEMADRHQKVAQAGLAAVVRRLIGVKKKDSSEWEIPPLNPALLDAFDVANLARVFVQIERLALELPADKREVSGRLEATLTYDEHRTVQLILGSPEATRLAARLSEQILQPGRSGALDPGGLGDTREP